MPEITLTVLAPAKEMPGLDNALTALAAIDKKIAEITANFDKMFKGNDAARKLIDLDSKASESAKKREAEIRAINSSLQTELKLQSELRVEMERLKEGGSAKKSDLANKQGEIALVTSRVKALRNELKALDAQLGGGGAAKKEVATLGPAAASGGVALSEKTQTATSVVSRTEAMDDYHKNLKTFITDGDKEVNTIDKLNHAGTEWARVMNGVKKAEQELDKELAKAKTIPLKSDQAAAAAAAYKKFGEAVAAIKPADGMLSANQQTRLAGVVSGAGNKALTASIKEGAMTAEDARKKWSAYHKEVEAVGLLDVKTKFGASMGAAGTGLEGKVKATSAAQVLATDKLKLYTDLLASPNMVKGSADFIRFQKEQANALVAVGKATNAAANALARYNAAQQASLRNNQGVSGSMQGPMTAQSGAMQGPPLPPGFRKDGSNPIGKNFLANIQHVTAWAASVGTLYGALGMLRKGAGAFTEIEYQVARLSQVFRGNQDQVGSLTQSILSMAAANGRSSQEAMESAIQWSRLGLNRVEVNEAVRVSLRAANVAEISSAQATEHLSSMMAVYSLKATELEGVLGMLNATSNTFNVTNAQLFEGITRTSAAAKQAGLSLAELVGLIGAGVGNTGQSGANIGNAIKSMIGSLTAPDKQKMLRDTFGFETIDQNTGGIKDMSRLLGDMFVKMQDLTAAERQSFIFGVAGKNQASRVTALLDNYIKANELAIHALLNLNSAEKENEKIKGTLKNQLVGLITEFERFSYTLATFGAQTRDAKTGEIDFKFTGASVLNDAVHGLKNLLAVMSAFGGTGGALVLSFLVAMAARLAFVAATTGTAGASAGFLRNSWVALSNAGREVMATCIGAAQAVGRFSIAATVASVRARVLAVSFVSLRQAALTVAGALALSVAGLAAFAGIGAIIAGASWAISKVTEALGLSSDSADTAFDAITFKAQQAGAAAEAASLQIKLMDTAMRALGSQKDKGKRQEIINRVVEAIEPENVTKRTALRNELSAISAITNEEQRAAGFKIVNDRVAAQMAATRMKKRQEEAAFDAQSMRNAHSEMDRLNRKWFASEAAKKAQSEKIETLKKKRLQRAFDSDSDESSAHDRIAQGGQHKRYAATTQGVMEDIKNLFADMPGSSFGDMLNKELMTITQQVEMLDEQKVALDAKRKALGGDAADRELARQNAVNASMEANLLQRRQMESLIKAAAGETVWTGADSENPFASKATGLGDASLANVSIQELKRLRDEVQRGAYAPAGLSRDEAVGKISDLIAAKRQLNDLDDESARLTSDLDRLRQSAAGRASGDFGRVEAALAENKAKREGLAIEAEAARQRRAVADIRDQRAAGGLFAGGDIAVAGAYGNNAAEETAARLAEARWIAAASSAEAARLGGNRAALNESAGVASQLGEGAAEYDLRNQSAAVGVRLELEMGKAMQANKSIQEDLTKTVNDQVAAKQAVIKAEKDYQKSIALAGPGEMLRKLAISKLTGGKKFDGAQFLAFDEGSRRDMMPKLEANRALGAANRGMANEFGNGNRDQQLDAYQQRMKQLQEQALALMQQGAIAQKGALDNSALAAAAMTTQLDGASMALAAFATEVRAAMLAVAGRNIQTAQTAQNTLPGTVF